MPRPRSLTPDTIAAAALTVIDRDGLASLTMRTAAKELGMGTMSLYRYVDDREQLEGLVVGHILDTVDTRVQGDAPWRDRLTVLSGRIRESVRAHPRAVPLLLVHRHTASATRRWGEAVLATLGDAGLDAKQRAIAFRCLLSFLLGRFQTELVGPLDGKGTAALAELPASEYPWLAETARHARALSAEEDFRGGLQIVLRGIEDLCGAAGPAAPGSQR